MKSLYPVLFVALLLLGGCQDPEELPALSASKPPAIRVLLGGRRRKEAKLAIEDQRWEVKGVAGRTFVRKAHRPLTARIQASARGIRLDGEDTGATRIRIEVEREFVLEGIRYAGALLLFLDEGRVRFVNEVDLETYVTGVIPNEMAPQATGAAYRTQAVAARTYGWIRLAAPGVSSRRWHLTDDQSSQVYTGLDPRYGVSYEAMRRHAADTAGVILTWQSRPFPAYYSSTCGGHTTDPLTSRLDPGGATEPLRGVRCTFCRTSPRFSWSKSVTDAKVVAGLEAIGRPIVAPVHGIAVSRKGQGGWAAAVTITYGSARKKREVPGPDFRSAIRVDSHLITRISRKPGGWLFEGRGWGHGVGLCQWGTLEMAGRGFSEAEILSWYYPGAAFTRVY